MASREVLVPLCIDCTRCTRVIQAPERLYTFCDILVRYGISIDIADHIVLYFFDEIEFIWFVLFFLHLVPAGSRGRVSPRKAMESV